MIDSKTKYNIFAIPFFISAVMMFYIFIALVNSGYFFTTPVLFVSASVFLIYLCSFLIFEIRYKQSYKFDILKLISILLGIFLGFWYADQIWFQGTLNLEPIANFLLGKAHVDTLYHVDIAESFITNGYPSIQFNGAEFCTYHVLSHLILAVISNLLNIPCFITYNYLYPIIFIPFYVLLFQYAAILFRKKYSEDATFMIADLFFLACFCMGFNFFGISDKAIFWYVAIIGSESFLVATIFMLLTIVLCLKFSKEFPKIILLIVIPVLLFCMTVAKVSVGFMFFLAAVYYLFRKNPKSIFTWGSIFLYLLVFFIAYIKFAGLNEPTSFYFLHFPRTFLGKKYFILHYAFYLVPSLLLFRYRTFGRFLSKDYFLQKQNVWAELTFLLTVAS